MAEAKQCPELVVLSIDGVPISLIRRLMDQGDMPNLASLAARGSLRQMRSVLPTVSCVAWASYMTGCNPGKHGLYGFVDRRANGYLPMFPNGSVLAASTIFEVLSGAGRKVFGMNVPGSYPPRPVKGIMIGGFLTPGNRAANDRRPPGPDRQAAIRAFVPGSGERRAGPRCVWTSAAAVFRPSS